MSEDEPVVVARGKNGYIGDAYHDLAADGESAACGRVTDPQVRSLSFAEDQLGLTHCQICSGEAEPVGVPDPRRRTRLLEAADDIRDGKIVDADGELVTDGGREGSE